MPCLVFALSLVVGVLASTISTVQTQNNTTHGYINKVGVPIANKIREAENQAAVNSFKSKELVKRFKRVVDGTPAIIGNFPYQAGLIGYLSRGITTCSGSLLTANRVITAAHCWWDGKKQVYMFTVVLGSLTLFSDGVRINTNQVIAHKYWDPSSLSNDIAMIYLPVAVKFSEAIQPIALPSGVDLWYSFAGNTVYASGYGLTRDGYPGYSLNFVELQVITNKQCSSYEEENVPLSKMCTMSYYSYSNVCNGDSGGPIALFTGSEYMLIGVTSYGWTNCVGPSVYTRISAYISWIHNHL